MSIEVGTVEATSAITVGSTMINDDPSGSNWFDTVSQNAMQWYDYLSRREQETRTAMVPIASVPGGGTVSVSQQTLIGLAIAAVVLVVMMRK